MALFQKNPHEITQTQQLYDIGLHKTLLIIGLGNIGDSYEGTRHNIGFSCVDALVETLEMPGWVHKKDLKCHLTAHTVGNSRVVIIKPTTLMNRSGEAAAAAAHFYKVPVESITAVHDDLAIDFGQIRMRIGGSDAGNNGVKSLTQHIGPNYGRIRIGIGKDTPMDTTDFVLAKFDKNEQQQLPHLIKETTAILTEYIYGGELPHETRTFIV